MLFIKATFLYSEKYSMSDRGAAYVQSIACQAGAMVQYTISQSPAALHYLVSFT